MSSEQDLWLLPREIFLVEGAAVTPMYTITFAWATSISGTPTVAIYKDGSSTDSADTYMPAGSHAKSGNTLTMKALAVLTPGTYVLVIYAAPDGMADAWKWQINVAKKHTRL